MTYDPVQEERTRREEAAARVKIKREARKEENLANKPNRGYLLRKIEEAEYALKIAQANLKYYDRIEAEESIIAKENFKEQRKEAIKNFNKAYKETISELANADLGPGKMSREENDAQSRLVSAYLRLEEFDGEITEEDEYSL